MILPDKTLVLKHNDFICSSKYLSKGKNKYNLILLSCKGVKASVHVYPSKIKIVYSLGETILDVETHSLTIKL